MAQVVKLYGKNGNDVPIFLLSLNGIPPEMPELRMPTNPDESCHIIRHLIPSIASAVESLQDAIDLIEPSQQLLTNLLEYPAVQELLRDQ